jgi:hypothetical protein
MSDNLTDGAEARVLNFLTGNTPATAPTAPLMVRLMTANGSDSAPGTEVVNAGGSSYTPQSVAFGAASGTTSTANSADIVFSNMPACTLTGLEIWDSAGSPFRWWWGPSATGNVPVSLGTTVRIVAGALTLTMQ